MSKQYYILVSRTKPHPCSIPPLPMAQNTTIQNRGFILNTAVIYCPMRAYKTKEGVVSPPPDITLITHVISGQSNDILLYFPELLFGNLASGITRFGYV